ncbi:MAG: ATP-grasp domain-containing protein [Burkholderiaceae bacterium]
MQRVGLLFNYDWDALAFARACRAFEVDQAGFDLFAFPSNARLIGFDLDRFANAQAARGRRRGWAGVLSHHEQFGALAAALVAERLGLPGTSVEAVLACQHKLHARRVLDEVCPEANVAHRPLAAAYGADIPDGLSYPSYVKPIKAAFSVLARAVRDRAELQAHTRFGASELWVIRRLVEPFERIVRARLPQAGSAHAMLLEEPVHAAQFNLDGWVFDGQAHAIGIVDAVMYPGTQAFMRWEVPSRLPAAVAERALDVARRFLAAVGFRHGMFNMEFFFDAASDRLSAIEFNPRLASQFSDLYQRVTGLDPHAMSIALALGRDPREVPRTAPVAGAAASFVYRVFDAEDAPRMPAPWQQREMKRRFPDALLFAYPKSKSSIARDFKWLGSYRYGILHLDARDEAQLRQRCCEASALLGWTPPYADRLGGQIETCTAAGRPSIAQEIPI